MSHSLAIFGVIRNCSFDMPRMVTGEDNFDSGILWDDIFGETGTPTHGPLVIPDCGRGGIIDAEKDVEVRELVIYCIGDIDLTCHAPELGIGTLGCEFEDCGQVIGIKITGSRETD